MATKYKIKQHVWCTNERHKSEVGVIAEVVEEKALVKTKDGAREETFIVLCSIILTGKCISRNFLNQS